jgi:hypothetical protein
MRETEWLTFIGSNERANPSMPLRHLTDDLELLTGRADSMVVQEFKLRGYWRTATRMMRGSWGASPAFAHGVARPVAGGQPVFWRRDVFKKVRALSWVLHEGFAGISEWRAFRRSLLEHRDTELRVWHLNSHHVVGADEAGDGPLRKEILYTLDLPKLDRALAAAVRSGWPAIGEIDANIHQGSAAYDELMAIFDKHGAHVVGEHGIEYLFVVDGRKAQVVVGSHSVVKPRHRGGQLWTDHEARVLRYKLREV